MFSSHFFSANPNQGQDGQASNNGHKKGHHPAHKQQQVYQLPPDVAFLSLNPITTGLNEFHTDTSSLWGLPDQDRFVYSPEKLVPNIQGMAIDEDLTPRAGTAGTWSTDSYDSNSSGFSVPTAQTSMDEFEPVAVAPPIQHEQPLFFQYLRGLTDFDLLKRRQHHQEKTRQMEQNLFFMLRTIEPGSHANYIDMLRNKNKHHAEAELANGELLFRDIQRGNATPFAPDFHEKFCQHLLNCKEQVESDWNRHEEKKRPSLTPTAIQFLTQPHPNNYFAYLHQLSDDELRERYNVYRMVTEQTRQTLRHLIRQGQSQIVSADLQTVKGGVSLFEGNNMQLMRDIGKYQAEAYLAKAEMRRRQMNRGEMELPSEKALNTRLELIGENLADIETDFKPNPR